MTHLLAGLLRPHDPLLFVMVVVEALLGCAVTTRLLVWRPQRPGPGLGLQALGTLMFGFGGAVVSWATFLTALAGTYPKLSLVVPAAWAAPAMALSLCSRMVAGWIHLRGRRSARNAMVAGSLLGVRLFLHAVHRHGRAGTAVHAWL